MVGCVVDWACCPDSKFLPRAAGGRSGAEAGPNATNTGNIIKATQFSGTLMGVQYESWFTPHNLGSYENAEAIPILGKYRSYDVNVIRKHEEWFENLGVDWLLLDWSNMLWIKPAWEEHRDATHELEETTDLLFKTYAQMEKEGKHPPKLVIMVGLQNGPPVPHAQERLNGIIAWTKKNFLDKPEYKNQWLYYHGKPLLVILNNVGLSCDAIAQQTAGVVAPDWTVRYMGSQLQETHVEKCGFWSWIDAPIRQVLTSRDGMPEEVVVTPSSYPIPGSECNAGCNTMLGAIGLTLGPWEETTVRPTWKVGKSPLRFARSLYRFTSGMNMPSSTIWSSTTTWSPRRWMPAGPGSVEAGATTS